MKKQFSIISLAMLIIIAGFSYGFKTKTVTVNGKTVVVPDNAETKYAKGFEIYKAKCVACHQLSGEGVPSAFPPLKNSDYLFADKKRAVAQVLNGSNHEITVNGAKYSIAMPPQVDNHEDAVAVINYVLNAWGNNGGTITIDEVKDIEIKR
jgi:nitrite reductase (NO-forming)